MNKVCKAKRETLHALLFEKDQRSGDKIKYYLDREKVKEHQRIKQRAIRKFLADDMMMIIIHVDTKI